MPLAISPVPEISISLASPEEPSYEPFSPFSLDFSAKAQVIVDDDSSWRATLLSPPPIHSPRRLSPLRPVESPIKGQGLERDRFEALLKASRERNTALGTKRSVDLRKEIALKAHKSKQVERRALFLSKVQAPPSPTATLTPKTPPESPAIFHYTLPSPGLESPIEVFESLAQGKGSAPMRKPWVEQVDFRIPGQHTYVPSLRTAPVVSKRKPLPSLDQITARLSSHVSGAGQNNRAQSRPRLPAFLQLGGRSSSGTAAAQPVQEVTSPAIRSARPAPPTPVGRLQFPIRSVSPAESPKVAACEPEPCLPPSPTLASPPKLQITTTVVPRTSSVSPTELSESNLLAFNSGPGSREVSARQMLTRLKRRTLPPVPAHSESASPSAENEEQERKMRRRSAPPELPERKRSGFSHPILELPGAF
ncbi:uncharacterized protein FIBRA_02935 [Fibroporia radiculosa]|uniref:Uncharacterized protein n=1 Tax=Fibroporia radiculosa TaxID=599839 RepID=J4H246_9APHY|nr:uncharacterized protein FIBRA_02935 [Fibroporia radiculosa]CCM00889.1 predicted protein [Fibroporia radiculosa]